MSEHEASDAPCSQRVIHYPVGPDGAWWTEVGAHPGTQADCPKCLIPATVTSDRPSAKEQP